VTSHGPLSGIKVLDLGVLIAGPLVGAYFGDLGADVVKVERPGGDPARKTGRFVEDVSLIWKYIGRNKRTIALDFGDDADREVLEALIAEADVVIENFRPGVLERHDLAPARLLALNPRLVITRISGFGQSGPYRDRSGFGTVAESMVGFVNLNGWPDGPPTLPPVALADTTAALAAAVCTLSAVLRARATGEGDVVDVSLLEPLLNMMSPQFIDYQFTGRDPVRVGNRLEFAAPRGAYRCRDGGWIALSGATPRTAASVFEAIGRADLNDDPRFATNAARIEHVEEIDRILADWAATRTREEAVAALESTGAAIGPVYSMADILADPHFRDRGTFTEIPDEELGSIKLPNVFGRFERANAAHRHAGRPVDADREAIVDEWLGRAPSEAVR